MSKYYSEKDIRAINGLKETLSHESILSTVADVMWSNDGYYLTRYEFETKVMEKALDTVCLMGAINFFDLLKGRGEVNIHELIGTMSDYYQHELERYVAENISEIGGLENESAKQ